MKILNEIYKDQIFDYKIFDWYFKNAKIGIFDIETTGLSPKNSNLILSGFVLPLEDGTLLSKQIFAESLDDEPQVIEDTLNILNNLDCIVTYNGASFDVPFLQKRMSHHKITNNYMPYNLDIYRVLKKYSPIKEFMPNLKQTTVENFMGLWDKRMDQIDGGISVDLYAQYLTSKDMDLERQILLHNSDDVKQLYRLLEVLKKSDLHRAMCAFGFPCGKGNEFIIETIKLTTKKLKVTGKKIGKPFFYESYDDESRCNLKFDGHKFDMEILLINEDVLTFINLDDFNMKPSDFQNCEGVYDHYLVLATDKNPNPQATSSFIKKIIERIGQ